MARPYQTPLAFKQALEQRIRNQFGGDGRELARVRQLVVFDRFLARLAVEFKDDVVVKGGLVLELRLARARTTKDIDLRLVGSSAETLTRLQRAGRLDLGDWLTFEVAEDKDSPTIEAEGMHYDGLRFRVEAQLGGKIFGKPFGLDVAFAEPLSGEPELLDGHDYLSFVDIPPTSVRVYPLETHIAEKLHAYTVPRQRPNSRVKDLPDMALLGTVRPLDAEIVRAAIERTFEHRATHDVPKDVPLPPADWASAYERMAQDDALPWPTLTDVHQAVQRFLNPILAGTSGRWDVEQWQWRPR